MRKVSGFGIAGLVVLGLVAGCSGPIAGSSGGAAAPAAPAERDATGGGTAFGSPQAGSPPGGAKAPTNSGSGSSSPLTARIAPELALIRTVAVSVAVDDVTRQAQRAADLAVAAGGDVYGEELNNGATPVEATADLTLKVPPDSFQSVLGQLAGLGREVSRHTSTEDVSEQVADVDSRVSSARGSLARIRALYAKATTIAEITSLEAELAQRESDLESLEARQRALAAQTASATITLHLFHQAATAAPAAPAKPRRTGFWGGLTQGWHAFARTAGWVFTAVGTLLPFLVVLGLAGWAAWWLRRRRLAPRPAVVPAATPAEP